MGLIRKIINRITKKRDILMLDEAKYKDLVASDKIESIISNMPSDLSNLEKAYYVYTELGKVVSENPEFVFTDRAGKETHYNDQMDTEFYGICKSISELYVSVLKDKRIGIEAELVKKSPQSPITHIDTVLKVDGKYYIANLISDLSKIKSSRRIDSFGAGLERFDRNPKMKEDYEEFVKKLEKRFGKFATLTREQREEMDAKLGYSYLPQVSKDESNELSNRGLYTEDVIELLRKDMQNPESFKKYVLHDKDVPKEEHLKYKLKYIFDNINKYTDYTADMNYLENIRYYIYVAKKLLPSDELNRINTYVATIDDDKRNVVSIFKVSPNEKDGLNDYFMYSKEDKKYNEVSQMEMNDFLNSLSGRNVKIIGEFDRYRPMPLSELER
mgnify:CR=1 FL=1